jgi:hypothetical protein
MNHLLTDWRCSKRIAGETAVWQMHECKHSIEPSADMTANEAQSRENSDLADVHECKLHEPSADMTGAVARREQRLSDVHESTNLNRPSADMTGAVASAEKEQRCVRCS